MTVLSKMSWQRICSCPTARRLARHAVSLKNFVILQATFLALNQAVNGFVKCMRPRSSSLELTKMPPSPLIQSIPSAEAPSPPPCRVGIPVVQCQRLTVSCKARPLKKAAARKKFQMQRCGGKTSTDLGALYTLSLPLIPCHSQ